MPGAYSVRDKSIERSAIEKFHDHEGVLILFERVNVDDVFLLKFSRLLHFVE
jgi:hypothetical protein